MTLQEVARLFKVSRKTLQRWEKAGLLVPVRIGTTIRYRPEDIERLLDQAAAS